MKRLRPAFGVLAALALAALALSGCGTTVGGTTAASNTTAAVTIGCLSHPMPRQGHFRLDFAALDFMTTG